MDVETKLGMPLDMITKVRRGGRDKRSSPGGGIRKKGTLSSTSAVRARASPYATRLKTQTRGPPRPAGSGPRKSPTTLRRVGRPVSRGDDVVHEPLSGGDYIKVGGGTVPRNLAGLIGNQVTSGTGRNSIPSIVAVGPASVNQAVKGLAIAKRALEEKHTDFYWAPAFVHLEAESLNAIQVTLERARNARNIAEMEGMELRVAGATEVKSLAGALATNARDGANSFVAAVGANSVNQAVKAIAIARGYVNEDDKLDLRCRSSIEEIEEGVLAGKSSVTIVVETIRLR